MSWFLKKSNGVEYGPTDLETLRAWAADGRIAPDDRVSRDRAAWTPAAEEALLEIEWVIAGPEGDAEGPFHLSSFAEWYRDGSLPPETTIRNVRTNRRGALSELFGPLEPTLPAEPAPQIAPLEPTPAESFAAARVPAAPAEGAIPERVAWQALARERDALVDEARKRQLLYEQEIQAARRREAELTARLREVEQELIRQQTASERAQKEALAYRKEIEAAAGEGVGADWSVAYHALARAHQALSEELDAKLRELRTQREETARLAAAAEERVRQAEAQVAEERRKSDEIRRTLSELEQTHAEVVRSLRDLNDRYVRLRERYAGALPSAPEAAPSEKPAAAPRIPAASGARIRLMR